MTFDRQIEENIRDILLINIFEFIELGKVKGLIWSFWAIDT